MLEGFLTVDKPQGLTSHDVVNRIRRLSGVRRVGHAGTLDPLATGVLLIGLGRATRLVEYVMGQPKTYETAVRLGQTTNTYDAEGQVMAERPIPTLSITTLDHTLNQFRGAIQQHPPVYAAIKQNGQPLYKLARRGEVVETQARPVTIYELEVLAWELPFLHLRVVCSAGTYIRSLAHDVGEVLGCGGHVAMLRRTAVGEFRVQDATSLDQLTQANLPAMLQSTDTAVHHLPPLVLSQDEAQKIQQGQQIVRRAEQPTAVLVRAYHPENDFIGILTLSGDNWQPHKIWT